MSAQTSPNLAPEKEIESISRLITPCSYCGIRESVWTYMPGSSNACDECVPRGCSCNAEPLPGKEESNDPADFVEPRDEKGRLYPCCEWMPIDVPDPANNAD